MLRIVKGLYLEIENFFLQKAENPSFVHAAKAKQNEG